MRELPGVEKFFNDLLNFSRAALCFLLIVNRVSFSYLKKGESADENGSVMSGETFHGVATC